MLCNGFLKSIFFMREEKVFKDFWPAQFLFWGVKNTNNMLWILFFFYNIIPKLPRIQGGEHYKEKFVLALPYIHWPILFIEGKIS